MCRKRDSLKVEKCTAVEMQEGNAPFSAFLS